MTSAKGPACGGPGRDFGSQVSAVSTTPPGRGSQEREAEAAIAAEPVLPPLAGDGAEYEQVMVLTRNEQNLISTDAMSPVTMPAQISTALKRKASRPPEDHQASTRTTPIRV